MQDTQIAFDKFCKKAEKRLIGTFPLAKLWEMEYSVTNGTHLCS